MDSLENSDSWNLVELLQGRKTINYMWVYKIKINFNGKVDRYRGRLVEKGFAQKVGIDFHETFSPIIKFVSI